MHPVARGVDRREQVFLGRGRRGQTLTESLSHLVAPDDCDLDRGATPADEVGQILLAEELQVLIDAEARPTDGQLAIGRPRPMSHQPPAVGDPVASDPKSPPEPAPPPWEGGENAIPQ